MKEQE